MTSLRAEVSIHRRVSDIGRAAWDACADNPDHAANPFVSYDFLDIAEEFRLRRAEDRVGAATSCSAG